MAQRTDLLASRNWTTKKAHNNCTLWDRTSGRRRWAFLGQPAHCGTKPRWAFLGRPCGSRPNRGSAFLGHRRWDQTKVGFSRTPLWDRTKPRWAFLERSCGTRPRQTIPDKTKADAGEGGLFLNALVEPDHARRDRTKKTKAGAGEGGHFLNALVEPDHARPDRTNPKQTREKVGFP
jgi:hypothetical protein